MSIVCPHCHKENTELVANGSRPALCPACRRLAIVSAALTVLKVTEDWLKKEAQDYLGAMNIMLLAAFTHASRYRLDNPDHRADQSWEAFMAPGNAQSYLVRMLSDGDFTDNVGPALMTHVRSVHDAAFFGQMAIVG